MKATGIVRKVDELGRIVLPIELRRTLKYRDKGSFGNLCGWRIHHAEKISSRHACSVEIQTASVRSKARTYAPNASKN